MCEVLSGILLKMKNEPSQLQTNLYEAVTYEEWWCDRLIQVPQRKGIIDLKKTTAGHLVHLRPCPAV